MRSARSRRTPASGEAHATSRTDRPPCGAAGCAWRARRRGCWAAGGLRRAGQGTIGRLEPGRQARRAGARTAEPAAAMPNQRPEAERRAESRRGGFDAGTRCTGVGMTKNAAHRRSDVPRVARDARIRRRARSGKSLPTSRSARPATMRSDIFPLDLLCRRREPGRSRRHRVGYNVRSKSFNCFSTSSRAMP